MKRFLSAGEGYGRSRGSGSPAQPQKDKVFCVSWCAPKVTGMWLLVAFFWLCWADRAEAQGGGRATTDAIRPLQIGDTIPEALWDLPLQVVNHPEGREVITLGEYRGGVILLDFLSTGCSSCIQALPRLEKLGHGSDGGLQILAITPQRRDQVAAFIPANSYTKGMTLPVVVGDVVLKQHFPHQYISHVVWISGEGVVRAFTGTSHVTARTIAELQSGQPLDWPVKAEMTAFFGAPLVTFQGEAHAFANNARRPLQYALITGYTEGVGPYVATKADSLAGIRRVSFRNRPILDLYVIALGDDFPGRERVIWEVPDPSAYALWKADLSHMTRDEWYRDYAVCYERTVPLGVDRQTWCRWMLSDLNGFLGLDGRLESRDGVRYFVLSNQQ